METSGTTVIYNTGIIILMKLYEHTGPACAASANRQQPTHSVPIIKTSEYMILSVQQIFVQDAFIALMTRRKSFKTQVKELCVQQNMGVLLQWNSNALRMPPVTKHHANDYYTLKSQRSIS